MSHVRGKIYISLNSGGASVLQICFYPFSCQSLSYCLSRMQINTISPSNTQTSSSSNFSNIKIIYKY